MSLVMSIPRDRAPSVIAVENLSPFAVSILPEMLDGSANLPVVHPHDRIETCHIYAAPPDVHMLVKHDRVPVRPGPKKKPAVRA